MSEIILVTGGARSGKSAFAESLASSSAGDIYYIATAQAKDEEMAVRIKRHRERRPSFWVTIEEPLYPSIFLREGLKKDSATVIIDCLTLLVSNLLLYSLSKEKDKKEKDIEFADRNTESVILGEIENILAQIKKNNVRAIIVTNEVGSGIVPLDRVTRLFRDIAGKVNQMVARDALYVYMMVAGIPVKIKP